MSCLEEEGAELSSIGAISMSFCGMCVNLICTESVSDGVQKLNILNSGCFEWDAQRARRQNQISVCSSLLSNVSTEVMMLAPQKHANETAQAHII